MDFLGINMVVRKRTSEGEGRRDSREIDTQREKERVKTKKMRKEKNDETREMIGSQEARDFSSVCVLSRLLVIHREASMQRRRRKKKRKEAFLAPLCVSVLLLSKGKESNDSCE